MLLSHEFRDIRRSASLRQDGSSSRGRKTKHNTATRNWIDTVGLPDLAAGKLPEAKDLAMLRSGPRGSLSGAALAARDAWSQQHARDPRSKQLTASKQLKWRYTAFNAAGQSAIAIDTESCSMYDAALVAAHRAQRRAAHYWEHGIPYIATCDNPAKDGRGLVAAVWAGDGKPECLFPGTTVLVETEAQCNAACAYLAGFEMLGCDVENVAYLDGSGTNSDQAAIVQLCGDERRCFIFEVHKWPSSYASFATLMADSSVKKVANNWSGDVARILKRFAARDGAPTRGQPFSDIGGRVELADTVSHLNLKSKSLENMVSAVLGQYLDKAVDHRCWEAPVLSPRHIEYAAADAWAHLRVWRVAPTKTAADMAVDDGLLGAAPLDPVEEDGDGAPSLSEEENEESEA